MNGDSLWGLILADFMQPMGRCSHFRFELCGQFCYAAPVMSERHLAALIRQIDAGDLSKNKNFEAYADPLVREAKQRQLRLQAIRDILQQAERGSWQLHVNCDDSGQWLLRCRSARWNLDWSASLREFEIELLREWPAARRVLDAQVSEEMSLSAV